MFGPGRSHGIGDCCRVGLGGSVEVFEICAAGLCWDALANDAVTTARSGADEESQVDGGSATDESRQKKRYGELHCGSDMVVDDMGKG